MPPKIANTGGILEALANLGAAGFLWWAYLGRADRHRKAIVLDDGRLCFGLNRRAIIAWILLAGWIAWIAIDQWRYAHGVLDYVEASMLTVAGVSLLLDVPGDILVGPEGLEQKFWIRRNRFIRWDEIADVDTYERDPKITIKSDDGAMIVHSSRLPDRSRFLGEIQQHCAVDQTSESPGELMGDPEPHAE